MECAQTDPKSTVTSETVQAWLCKAVTTKKKLFKNSRQPQLKNFVFSVFSIEQEDI